jgi:hypothetical protein
MQIKDKTLIKAWAAQYQAANNSIEIKFQATTLIEIGVIERNAAIQIREHKCHEAPALSVQAAFIHIINTKFFFFVCV